MLTSHDGPACSATISSAKKWHLAKHRRELARRDRAVNPRGQEGDIRVANVGGLRVVNVVDTRDGARLDAGRVPPSSVFTGGPTQKSCTGE